MELSQAAKKPACLSSLLHLSTHQHSEDIDLNGKKMYNTKC